MRIQKFILLPLFLFLACVCAASQEPGDADTPAIILKRHGCYETCPIYTINIFSDGRVTFVLADISWGSSAAWNTQISQSELDELVNVFLDAGFLEWERTYEFAPDDAPTSTLTLNWDGKSKSVHYGDEYSSLESIAKEIDRVADTPAAQAILKAESAKTRDEYIKYNGFSTGLVKLERLGCDTSCPVYSIAIQNDGAVHYKGTQGVRVTGPVDSQLTPDKTKSIFHSVLSLRIMSRADSLANTHTVSASLPDSKLSVTLDSMTQIIYFSANMPIFAEFANLIDTLVNVNQWIEQ